MHYSFPPDLQRLIEVRLASGRYSTEDEVLPIAARRLADEDEDIVAVGEAVAECAPAILVCPWRLPLTRCVLRAANDPEAKGIHADSQPRADSESV